MLPTTHNLVKLLLLVEKLLVKQVLYYKETLCYPAYDLEGKREDKDGKPGKIKACWVLDLKRSDTPDYMQKFLEELLMMVLTGSEEKEVTHRIIEFLRSLEISLAGTRVHPKRVNNQTNSHKDI